MHKIILVLFGIVKNAIQFVSIFCSFLTTIISLFWIEAIIQANWSWLDFIRPMTNAILDFSKRIIPVSYNAFGTIIDVKYITAILLLILVILICRKILFRLADLEIDYHNLHIKVLKYNEEKFNKNLIKKFNENEKKVTDYMIIINTQWKKNLFKRESDNLGEQNKHMNDFIYSQTGVKHSVFNNGFLYNFSNFEKIDEILDIMFKLLSSSAPIDYSISIQVGDNLQLLKKLSDLKEFNKITISAETLYRYNLNKSKKYQTQSVGIFQYENLTLEVHEFKEEL